MPLILAILTFAVFIGISYFSDLMKRRIVSKTASDLLASGNSATMHLPPKKVPAIAILPSTNGDSMRVEGYTVPESLYYHQGHSWVALQDSGMALVGIDEFASKLIGKATSITLPQVGDRCRQGAKGWSISRKRKVVNMLFPLDGEVVAVNEKVVKNPELVLKEPYGNGWLLMVKAPDLNRNLRNLLSGPAIRRWTEESAANLRTAFSGKLGMVFQDGGLPEEGLSDYFGIEEWHEISSRIFMMERAKGFSW